MIIAIGVDSLPIQRLHDLWQRAGERLLCRIFTPDERSYCLLRHRPAESFAARFCAKEAVMKCLGTGWTHGIGWQQIEVVRGADGAVGIALHGAASDLARRRGIRRFHLSLTHTAELATAFAVAEG